MTNAYLGATAEDDDHGSDGSIDDTGLKWLGMGLSSLFALAVLALVAYIVATQIDFVLMRIILPQFVGAYLLVSQIVVTDGILSVAAGVFVGFAHVSKTAIMNGIVTAYIQFSCGTPLLFQIFVIYFGIPTLWPGTFPIQNRRLPTAIIALTLSHATYVGETIRSGIRAVPDGQMEAAQSPDMGYIQGMCKVVVLQARCNAPAVIGSDQVILVKGTSLLTIIAVPELMQTFRSVNSVTFNPWTPLILVATTYLLVTLPLMRLMTYSEERSDWGGDHR